MERQDSEVTGVPLEVCSDAVDLNRRSRVIQVFEIEDPTPSSDCYQKLGCAIGTLAAFIILTILLFRIFA